MARTVALTGSILMPVNKKNPVMFMNAYRKMKLPIKNTSFDSKVPEEAHSVDPPPLKVNVTTLPEEL